ncbi:MAG: 2OG-Fe(II) oxygenase, partial [Novosphingobium sp.]
TIPPQPGALLIWNNMKPDGTPNPNSMHAGMPVVRGTKYVLTKWYRARQWH